MSVEKGDKDLGELNFQFRSCIGSIELTGSSPTPGREACPEIYSDESWRIGLRCEM